MPANDYHFITHWSVEGTADEVYRVLSDASDLPRWWPAVYLSTRVLDPGGAGDVGRVVDLHTRGWLPYTLRWQFRVTEAHPPDGFTLEAWGDFVGRGIWTLEQDGSSVNVVYDWQIRADKPLLRRLSFLLKPVFSANHRWAMAKGLESLRLELARLQMPTVVEVTRLPKPPGPPSLLSFLGLVAVTGGGLAWLLARWLPRRRLTRSATAG